MVNMAVYLTRHVSLTKWRCLGTRIFSRGFATDVVFTLSVAFCCCFKLCSTQPASYMRVFPNQRTGNGKISFQLRQRRGGGGWGWGGGADKCWKSRNTAAAIKWRFFFASIYALRFKEIVKNIELDGMTSLTAELGKVMVFLDSSVGIVTGCRLEVTGSY
jgi:hypothetical protein